MIRNQPRMKFQSKKMQQNPMFYRQFQQDSQYIPTNANTTIAQTGFRQNIQTKSGQNHIKDQIQAAVDLEDIWQSLQIQSAPVKSNIKVSLMDIAQQPQQLTAEQFDQVFGTHQTQLKKQKQEVQDLTDLWNNIDDQQNQICHQNSLSKQHHELTNQNQINNTVNNSIQQLNKSPNIDSFEIIESPHQDQITKGFQLKLGHDFLIYDYYSFVMNCFQTNIRCYFGFYQSKEQKNHYFLYNLQTKQPLIECSVDTYEDLNVNSKKKIKIDYDTNYCLKFRLSRTKQHIATVFQKYINNGIVYNLKPYNCLQSKYQDSFALIEITDGYAANNCFCNTSVFISQKYTDLPGQLKMILGIKNGFLIANMGLVGVKSAPYNCRLQNTQNKFVYLLGLIDKQAEHFVVRVGQGMSPLLSLAISIGRKRYIQSFKQQ